MPRLSGTIHQSVIPGVALINVRANGSITFNGHTLTPNELKELQDALLEAARVAANARLFAAIAKDNQ